jgi:hypothetical protein
MPRGRWLMGFRSPEKELEAFLAALPSWHRKILQLDYPLSWEELLAWQRSDWFQFGGQVDDQFLQLIERCPAEWREYRRRKKKLALMDVPMGQPGRPETPREELMEIIELKAKGWNNVRIARHLGLTMDSVKQRLKTARRKLSS